MSDALAKASALRHGAAQLSEITVDTYNADLRDGDGFVGDRASRRAFVALVEDWRQRLRKSGHEDPLGEISARDLKKKKLDKVLVDGEPEAAALVHSATEDFAQELAAVIRSASCGSRSGVEHRPFWSAVGSGRTGWESLRSAALAFF